MCLSLWSTDFLQLGSSYMYPNLDDAYASIRTIAETIRKYGLPKAFQPFIVGFTGRGNVSKGAQEVFQLLPHEYISVTDLPKVVRGETDLGTKIGLVEVTQEAMVRLRRSPDTTKDSGKEQGTESMFSIGQDTSESPLRESHTTVSEAIPEYIRSNEEWFDKDFDKEHYREYPEKYEPIFHHAVAPYLSGLVNCMYWDNKFPRLLATKQLSELYERRSLRLIGICDISCDHMGSLEFLREFSSIDDPYYIFDPLHDSIIHGNMDAPGVLMHAVDHLPTEVPADASKHFGDCLLEFIPKLAHSDGSKPFEEQDDLPPELKSAMITCHGELTPAYRYINQLRESSERAQESRKMKKMKGRMTRTESFLTITLKGHLFDSGIINRILDLIEDSSVSANITDMEVGKNKNVSTAVQMSLFAPRMEDLEAVISKIKETANSLNTSLTVSSSGDTSSDSKLKHKQIVIDTHQKNILLLGSGFVTLPLVRYLLRKERNFVTVASMIEEEARELCSKFPRCTPTLLNVADPDHREKLESLVSTHDVVVSLVPAFLHPVVAKVAIRYGKHMVTASYVSEEMQDLDEDAKQAGVCVLNEAGLDPGIDHMSAMAMLEEAKKHGEILSFSSVCGGLPAPEAANNVLGYKFSWSPRGVLTAALNTAKWMEAGKEICVKGEHLLTAAKPYFIYSNPAFNLECLPNRVSTVYREKYNVPDVPNIFRGTLRYAGYSLIMHSLVCIGMLSQEKDDFLDFEKHDAPSYREWTAYHAGVADAKNASDDDIYGKIIEKVIEQREKAAREEALPDDVPVQLTKHQSVVITEALVALGLMSSSPISKVSTKAPIDVLVKLLESLPEMSYGENERDMALMQHEVLVRCPDGSIQRHVSKFCEYANPQGTAMSRTVGLSAAIATQLMLDNEGGARVPGVTTPTSSLWYKPILEHLTVEGIKLDEFIEPLTTTQAEKVLPRILPNYHGNE